MTAHGTYSHAKHRCRPRCPACDAAYRAYNRELAALHRRRRGDPRMVDAAPVAAHIRRLVGAGWSMAEVARAAGISSGQAHNIVGRSRRVLSTTAARVLAVDPQARRPAQLVEAGPVVVLIRWLQDRGATRSWICRQLGLASPHLWVGLRPTVQRRTAARVRALALAVGSGEVVPPGVRRSVPDRPCAGCGVQGRDGGHRLCRTCQRRGVTV